MRFQLRQGRLLNDADNTTQAPLRIVVNESLVRRLFPNTNPLGEKLKVNMGNDNPAEIIGVIADARINGLAADPRPQIYVPHAQLAMNFATLVLRTDTREPESLTQPILQIVREIDPLLPVVDIATMETRIGKSLATQSFLASLLTGLSALAFLMALVGVYGLMSYAVQQRTHEFGVRLALGAAPIQVQSKVVLRGLLLGAIGTTAGTIAALAAARVLKSLPYEVATNNPATYAIAALLLIVAAILAAYLPARRITRIDPLTALRYE
jgi:ABC-type antimicrobial peptide transport system permease subunit